MKPCPFCGYSKPTVCCAEATQAYWVVCITADDGNGKPTAGCGAQGPPKQSERSAKAAWNKTTKN